MIILLITASLRSMLKTALLNTLPRRSLLVIRRSMAGLAPVAIDDSGTYKYILIEGPQGERLVRGAASADYHNAIMARAEQEAQQLGVQGALKCLGGGKIQRDGHTIRVFGKSEGYGPADHTATVQLLKKAFPTANVTIGEE